MNQTEQRIGWCFFAFQLLVLPLLIVIADDILGLGLSQAEMNILLFGINLALSLMIFRRFLWLSLGNAIRHLWHFLQSAVLGFAAYQVGSFLLGLLFVWLVPSFVNVNDSNIGAMAAEQYTLIAIGTVLLVPITEEVLYRGLIFGSLQKKSRLAAYLVSMAAFAGIHVVGYIGTTAPLTLVLCFVQYLPAGLALAWAYERADSIWAPIVIHMTVNQIAMNSLR